MPRHLRPCLPVLALGEMFCLLAAALGAEPATAPRGVVVEPEPAILTSLADEAPGGHAGLFVGVNEFRDPNVSPLRFAVHDAVEQAYLFVVELKLIPPKNCYLALSGQPSAPAVQQHFRTLRTQGVHVTEANKEDILDAFTRVQIAAKQTSDLLVCAFSSHGFEDQSIPYIMPRNGVRRFLGETALRLLTIENAMRESLAGHRLLLVDACQERVAADSRTIVREGTPQAMPPAFQEELKKPTGQAKLASCSVGEFSYEHAELGGVGHGVFTCALLEALRGGAATDAQNLVRLGGVSEPGCVARLTRTPPEDDPS
jgi:hypothetical protein